jgi:hypothetical protein
LVRVPPEAIALCEMTARAYNHRMVAITKFLTFSVRGILRRTGRSELAEEANVNLMSRSDLLRAAATAGIPHPRTEFARLGGWGSNLLLIAKRCGRLSTPTRPNRPPIVPLNEPPKAANVIPAMPTKQIFNNDRDIPLATREKAVNRNPFRESGCCNQ